MEFQPVQRAADAFQQTVSPDQIQAICRRAFGKRTQIVSAVELGAGTYNNTYRVDLGEDRPVILRVAPEPARQNRIERELMRNEHASLPYFAPIGAMLPRTLAIDFTHEVIGRDYLIQTMLDGVPGPEGLTAYPRQRWASFYRQLGTIARDVHSVTGPHFGPVRGPGFATWSEAMLASLDDTAADLDDARLDATDVREVAKAAAQDRAVLDEITRPRLLHGDLWTVNVMLARDAPEPTITGVFDCDRTSWGDPAADWTIYLASRRPDRTAFWETYGAPSRTPGATRRALYYLARHLGAIRLERHRLGRPDRDPGTYAELSAVLTQLLA
ncbi:phosphotransferase family protein [Amycolatopsis sp. H20-H5]|uniref:phosphotransferase family protein n=1 Tax=Amycolatopsis sp. H20-H5 TaxID=3046309 RepID=UPI002DB6E1DD|nr:aminoglycoside phosphotransferase family protein [Amycolatopsis sp. H20-H5]MEC3976777.1 aminoglycoside phosphotransferase family protein [Amycolatopsis sp. H20-H5]